MKKEVRVDINVLQAGIMQTIWRLRLDGIYQKKKEKFRCNSNVIPM